MTIDPIKQLVLRKFHLFSFLIIALWVLFYGQIFAEVIRNNISGISSFSTEMVDGRFFAICQPGRIRYYPILITCVNYALTHEPGSGHEMIEKMEFDVLAERADLLKIYKSRLYWVEGKYRESCAELQQIENQREMTRLAEMALSQENWDALEAYLNCVGDVDNFQMGASPHKIAELNYQIGKYYESNQQESEALEAYLNAARWYPTVWADPVLAAAVIMETNGTRPRAIQMVSDYFSRAQLPWSVFYLGRKLGDYKFEDRDWIGAYCAYLRANLAGSESPASQVPDRIKEEILAKVSMLENNYGFNPTQCGSGYTTP